MEAKIKTETLETIKRRENKLITPFLWFDSQAEEAARFYVSIFKNARVKTTTQYGDSGSAASGMPEDSIMTVAFEIEGADFVALNGGPAFKPTPAISFMVNCRTYEKINELWAKLSDGGKILMELDQYPFSERYGWIEDKYGFSWQLILSSDSQIIAPCIMFSGDQRGKAEEAMNYYMSVFSNSAVETISKYTDEEEGRTGTVKYGAFSLSGQNFKAMDNGYDVSFGFNPAVSFVVHCESQKEIDYFWEKLSAGGDINAQQCGWLADRFGVSWQVIPHNLNLWLSDSTSKGGRNVMKALISMKKLDMNILENAYHGNDSQHLGSNNDVEEIGANYEGADKTYMTRITLSPNEEL